MMAFAYTVRHYKIKQVDMCPMDTMPRQWSEKLWNTINACTILLTLDIIFTKEYSKEKNEFFFCRNINTLFLNDSRVK